MLLVLFFAYLLDGIFGYVTYENSWPVFNTLDGKKHVIKTWDKDKTPVLHVIEADFTLKDNAIYDLKMTDSFSKIYTNTNKKMERAESFIKRKEFSKALPLLDQIKSEYPYFPYLYLNYLYIFEQEKKNEFAKKAIANAEDVMPYAAPREKAIWYYRVYQYWNLVEKNYAYALSALKKSASYFPSEEKTREIAVLEEKLN